MKVKIANKILEVLFTKEVAGQTMYAVEDEPNHIDWLINVEVVDAEKKELKKIDNRFDYKHANIQQKDFAPKASFANRQLYNRAILAILANYIEKYPDIRFGQMLCNLDVNPHFDEESKETYCNLNETINKKS